MDYSTLNAIGISLLALFGLWAFQRGASAHREKRPPEEQPRSPKDDGN